MLTRHRKRQAEARDEGDDEPRRYPKRQAREPRTGTYKETSSPERTSSESEQEQPAKMPSDQSSEASRPKTKKNVISPAKGLGAHQAKRHHEYGGNDVQKAHDGATAKDVSHFFDMLGPKHLKQFHEEGRLSSIFSIFRKRMDAREAEAGKAAADG